MGNIETKTPPKQYSRRPRSSTGWINATNRSSSLAQNSQPEHNYNRAVWQQILLDSSLRRIHEPADKQKTAGAGIPDKKNKGMIGTEHRRRWRGLGYGR